MSPLSGINAVGGRPGWYYGLFVSSRDENGLPVYRFDVYQRGGRKIEGIESSAYRLTETARMMGDRHRLGSEEAAQRAIDEPEEGDE